MMFTKIKNYVSVTALGLLVALMAVSCTAEDFQNQAPAEAKSINQKDSLKIKKMAPETSRGTSTSISR
jgi:hypothetical protein